MSSPAAAGAPGRFARAMECWAEPRAVVAILAVYFAVMAVALAVFAPSGHFDDTVALQDAQSFQWGYEAKSPPLFVWLARAMMLATGPRIETVFALRMACLFAAFAGLYMIARRVQPDPLLAAGAGLAMLATLHLHWYFLDKYTNTALALAMMPYAVLAFFRLHGRRGPSSYALFGGIAGVGLLSRYHFAVLLAAMAMAALGNRKWRAVLLDRRMILALAIAGVIAAPHLAWFAARWPALAGDVQFAVGFDGAADPVSAALSGLRNLSEEALSILIFPLGVLLLGLLWPALGRARVADPDRQADLAFLRDTVIWSLVLMALFALAGASRIRSRHLFFLALLPLWMIGRLDAARLRRFAAPAFLLAIHLALAGAALGFAIKGWIYAVRCTGCDKVLTFADYAEAIRRAGFRGGTIVLSREMSRGAILRAYFPGSRVVQDFQYQKRRVPLRDGEGRDCVFVWRKVSPDLVGARFERGAPVPGVGLPLPSHAVFGSAPGRIALSGRPAVTLGFALVKGGLGTCR